MELENMTIKEVKEIARLASGLIGSPCSASKPENANGELQIVVMQRAHIVIGRFYQSGDQCRVEDARIIRCWGTTKGLAELIDGPTSKTILEMHGTIYFHEMSVIYRMPVKAEKWK
jgi:hypothetical protein